MAAAASLAGGLAFAAAGYAVMGLIGAVASALLPLVALGFGRRARVRPAA